MRVGIIGAGSMGVALAARLTRLGHQVAIANSRGPRTLAGVAALTGATPVPLTQVTGNAEVVIVAIPEKSIPKGRMFRETNSVGHVLNSGTWLFFTMLYRPLNASLLTGRDLRPRPLSAHSAADRRGERVRRW